MRPATLSLPKPEARAINCRMFDLKKYMEQRCGMIDKALDSNMPKDTVRPEVLHKAMRYSIFTGGKRLRPILCLAAAEAANGRLEDAILPALAIEYLHTYTLIHDDLPCMDDDDLRRGKPTSHKVFGEANAVLAGDALQTLAFETLAAARAPTGYAPNQLMAELALAGGSRGVIGGQVEDLAAQAKPTREIVEFVHLHKTAVLFRAAVRMGGVVANACKSDLAALTDYGVNLGMAFQITDDLLDAAPSVSKGKEPHELTCLSVYGIEESRKKAQKHVEKAVRSAEMLPCDKGSIPLVAIAKLVLDRKK
jgi:geranylgeranyl diphosphate synthase, type II